MIWKVSQSSSWKAKMSILEFAQTFVFTNFMSLCLHEKYVSQIEKLVIEMMSDVTLQVRQKATKILCGLFHSQFIDNEGQKRLLKVSFFHFFFVIWSEKICLNRAKSNKNYLWKKNPTSQRKFLVHFTQSILTKLQKRE